MSALEYRADLYDVIHGRRQHDIPWYVELARHVGGRVLELGAGTGRTALPVARAGIAIDALDVAEEMRAQLRKALEGETEEVRGRVRVLSGDMTRFSLPDSYGLIQIPFRSFLHNTTQDQQRACLERCHAHLAPGGLLALDVFLPSEEYMAAFEGDYEGLFRMDDPYPLPTGGFLLLSEWNAYDRAAQNVRAVHRYELLAENGRITESLYQILDLAWLYPDDLERLLVAAGFAEITFYSDFTSQPVGPETRDVAVTARRV
ncbi:class I SAM-dependent methyltransferase [Peteryoungia ipomoeae]|uniref:Class I SAM-dependent methyltransferase n=1 Tax=Peteryoungia ipomoeae TaxID=1210932 RepID=A0A4S8NTR7_9HYPH|nr:class I SAM-dependent methyltransferase [Peteryoungia ipomoeae]THV20883.1 class I SAM-dependent methyltransferase [Peteryoungia ipomoeae]